MNEGDTPENRTEVLQRLATLQRLREHAKKGHRAAMLKTIEAMMDQEVEALREPKDADAERT
jgi:hypothetical protein